VSDPDPLINLVDSRLGFVYSEEGVYEPGEIVFTIESGKRVEIGDIVCIRHPSKNTLVFYQVVEVPMRRKARDYEEDLVRLGKPLVDESRNYPRARAVQLGYIEDVSRLLSGSTDIDDLSMLIEHVKPLSEVYRPKDEVIERLLQPAGDSITVGKIYPSWKHEYRFNLQRLLRQGLLVVGGVGTGKTTTMLTILYRVVKAFLDKNGRPHVLIIDKDGEYGADALVSLVGKDNYVHIHVDDISEIEYIDKEEYASALLSKLGYLDKRSKAARSLDVAVRELSSEEPYRLEPSYVEDKILPLIKDRDVWVDIRVRLEKWKKEYSGSGGSYSITGVLELLRSKIVVHIDLSATRDYDRAYRLLADLLGKVYDTALRDPGFGCIVVIDEAHLYAPEVRGVSLASSDITEKLKNIIHVIATTGPRNGVTPFIATQRPSLISKTITTQMGQNIIAHRVEDVDLERIEEIMGPIARKVRVLPRGWAIVKGLAAKIREPLIVRVEAEAYPKSTGRTAYERFLTT